MENKKSLFISKQIRKLTRIENKYIINILEILQGKVDQNIIMYLPEYISYDNKIRPLILNKDIIIKIENKHGKIPIENLLINAHDFDYVLINFDKIWSFFSNDIHLELEEIQDITQEWLSETYNLKGVTTFRLAPIHSRRLCETYNLK